MGDFEFDVAIVGGGIGGLYMAWRLAMTTHLKIAVLEYSHRFGGRYQTCIMPGGFPADMGAMRYVPKLHPILHQLIQEMDLPVEKLWANVNSKQNKPKHYFRNKHIYKEELKDLYSFNEEDMLYCLSFDHQQPIDIPEDGNFQKAVVRNTGQLAKDMSCSQFVTGSSTSNIEMLNYGTPVYPLSSPMSTRVAYFKQFSSSNTFEYICIRGGMERLIDAIVAKLKQLNVCLKLNYPVTRIEELSADSFLVQSFQSDTSYKCSQLVMACNARGMELADWITLSNHSLRLKEMLSMLVRISAFKIFLTYDRAWWEDYGLIEGRVETDLPIGTVTAFGDRGTQNGYSTLLASFTYKYTEVFEGLNLKDAERFRNEVGDVPPELQPSDRLVKYIQKQLSVVFGCNFDDPPRPVCAACKLWGCDFISAAQYEVRIGVDSNKLNWKSLKPFDDSNIYITGDGFHPVNKTGCFLAWSEGALLNSERLLTNYFKLVPYKDGLSLTNDWPDS